MIFRWIALVALSLAPTSCSAVGVSGSTREFSGVWLHQFESSVFIEGAVERPTHRPPEKDTDWLEFASAEPHLRSQLEESESAGSVDCYPIQPFQITFIGYRTQRPFGGGHMGLWRSDVTVRQILSIKRLGPAFCYEDDIP